MSLTLYVTQPGAVVRREGGSLLVTLTLDPDDDGPLPEAREVLLEAEPHRLEALVLVGRVHITREALALCFAEGIGVAWLDWRGRLLGRSTPTRWKSGDLRLAQYAAHSDRERRRSLAAEIVAGKLRAGRSLLKAGRSNRPGEPRLARALEDLERADRQLATATGLEQVLGAEGAGAAAYFAGFAVLVDGPVPFPGRRRRPPPDPVNALLSFGYVLLLRRVEALVEARGLDPAIGFLHSFRPGRPSLALDLMEEFRHPLVDRLVATLFNRRQMTADHFQEEPQEGGVRMTRAGLRRFLPLWTAALKRPLRLDDSPEGMAAMALVARQADRLASALRHGDPYRPAEFL